MRKRWGKRLFRWGVWLGMIGGLAWLGAQGAGPEEGFDEVAAPCSSDPQKDSDGDGVCSDADNCPDAYNPLQEDADGDGLGDLCDPRPNDPESPANRGEVGNSGKETFEARYQALEAQRQKRQYAAALKEGEELLALAPAAPHLARGYYALGQCHFGLEHYEQAVANFAAAVAVQPEGELAPEAQVYVGQSWFLAGRAAMAGHDLTDPARERFRLALEGFGQVLRRYPENRAVAARAQYMMGSTYFFLDDLESAEASYRAILENYAGDSYEPKALYKLGETRQTQGDAGGAWEYYTRLIQQFPQDARVQEARKGLQEVELLGQPAPDLAVEEWVHRDGKSLAELRGQCVLLFFWATWCPNCRKEYPEIEKLVSRYAEQGLVVMGLTHHTRGQTTDQVREFAKRQKMSYPTGIDAQGQTSDRYHVDGVPAAALLDASGKILWRGHPAALRPAMIALALRTVEKPASGPP